MKVHLAIRAVDMALEIIETDRAKRSAMAMLIVRNLIEAGHVQGEVKGLLPLALDEPQTKAAPLCDMLSNLTERHGSDEGNRIWGEQQFAWYQWFLENVPQADAFARLTKQYPSLAPE